MKVYVIVRGDVQGVGFRSYAVRLANQLNLSGLVKNDAGGTVTLFLDGEEKNIEKFIQTAQTRKREGFFGMHVEKMDVFRQGERGFKPAWRSYSGFEVDF